MNRYLVRFTLARKLLIGVLALLIPLAALLWRTVAGLNARVRTAERERAGVRAVDALARLAALVPVHQRLTNSRLRGGAADAETEKTAQDIGKVLESLKSTPGAIDRELLAQTTDRWSRLWRDRGRLTLKESDARHQEIRESIVTLIARLGNASGLVLDSELDSYYLVQATVASMPGIQSEVADVLLSMDRDNARPDASAFFGAALSVNWAEVDRMRASASIAIQEAEKQGSAGATLRSLLSPRLAAYNRACEAFQDALKSADSSGSGAAGRQVAAQQLWDRGVELWQGADEALSWLLDRRLESARGSRLMAIVLTLVCASFAAAMLWKVARNTSRPLRYAVTIAGDIAAGRLEQASRGLGGEEILRAFDIAAIPADARDESMRLVISLQAMCRSLNGLLGDVQQSGVQVTGSATQMSAAILQLDGMVSGQAASTREVAATSNEIATSGEGLAKRTEEVAAVAADAVKLADEGMQSLESINSIMENLAGTAADLAKVLDTISSHSERIEKVIASMTRIANRTNLLSLNAAIEAEKGGKHAAGFSVVAMEIRRLADQTSVAALDIEDSVGAMRGAVREGVAAAETYAGSARDGSAEIARTTKSLTNIIEYTLSLGPLFETVNGGMRRQSDSASQITTAVRHLNGSAEETQYSLAELRSAAEALRAAVSGLRTGIARFATQG